MGFFLWISNLDSVLVTVRFKELPLKVSRSANVTHDLQTPGINFILLLTMQREPPESYLHLRYTPA